MNIKMYTDRNKFCVDAHKKISFFSDAKQYNKNPPPPSTHRLRRFFGAADLKKKDALINLPMLLEFCESQPYNLIEAISDTIGHEIMHIVLSEISNEANCVYSEQIIRRHFDKLQLYQLYYNIKRRENFKIIRGDKHNVS